MIATVKRFTYESCGGELIKSHPHSQLSIVNSVVNLNGPRFGFIASGKVESISFTSVNFQPMMIIDVLVEKKKANSVKEKWSVYFEE